MSKSKKDSATESENISQNQDDIKESEAQADEKEQLDGEQPDVSDTEKETSADIEKLNAQLAEALSENNRINSRLMDINTVYVRLQSDFDNYRKRMTEQVKNAKSEGAAEVIAKIIPVLDVINQALQMITDEKVAEGVQMINRQILDLLANFGVTEIPALGKPFDPEIHNAILQVNVENQDLDGQVIEVFQKGYRMGDKIIRHSVVKVARA